MKTTIIVTIALFVSSASAFDFQQASMLASGGQHQSLKKAVEKLDPGSVELNCLINDAIRDRNMPCAAQEKTLAVLLDQGAVPTESPKQETRKAGLLSGGFSCEHSGDLSAALNKRCEKIVEMLAAKLIPSEVVAGTSNSQDLFKIDTSQSLENKEREAQNRKVINGLINLMTTRCKGEQEACGARDTIAKLESDYASKLKSQEEAEKAAIDREKRAELDSFQNEEQAKHSPEGILARGCEAQRSIKTAEEIIAREQEIGKVSGVVNKAALHEAGTMKVYAKKDLDSAKSEYKKKSGKEMTLSRCKTPSQ